MKTNRGNMICPDCLREFTYAAERGGQAVNCPHCQAPLRLPVVVAAVKAAKAKSDRVQELLNQAEEEEKARPRFEDTGPEPFQPASFSVFFGVIAALACGGLLLAQSPTPRLILGVIGMVAGVVGILLAILSMITLRLNRDVYSGWGFATGGLILSFLFGGVFSVALTVTSYGEIAKGRLLARISENVSRIATGHFLYADQNDGRLPGDILNREKEPLLSWRVTILPFVGEKELFQKFKLDEPWDSPHNLALLPLLPSVFVGGQDKTGEGETVFLRPIGAGTFCAAPGARLHRDVFAMPFSRESTIIVLQVRGSAAVPWTRPADWEFTPDSPARNLDNNLVAGLADGTAVQLNMSKDLPRFPQMLTPDPNDSLNDRDDQESESADRED